MTEDRLTRGGLRFFQPSLAFQFFRGTVCLRYVDGGQHQTRYVHLSYRMGQLLPPLLKLVMPPISRKSVQLDFIYPPDSTPPQVLTVRTMNSTSSNDSLSAKNYRVVVGSEK